VLPPAGPPCASFMQESCGVLLGEDQHYLMEARLAPVAKTLNYPTGRGVRVRGVPARGAEVDDVAVGRRDDDPRDVVLPRRPVLGAPFRTWCCPKLGVFEPGNTRPLKIWSAACSTGQEPYSLLMFLDERFPSLAERTQIVATDVAEGVVEQASRGTFSVFEVNRGVSAPGSSSTSSATVATSASKRSTAAASPGNPRTSSPGGRRWRASTSPGAQRAHLLPEATRALVLKKVRAALRPGGFLGVGSTELIAGRP